MNQLKHFKIILIVSVFILTGCASTYQPYRSDQGYVDFPLNNNRYFVSFTANGYTTREKAYELALKRVHELGLEKEYKYFKIIESHRDASNYATSVGSNLNQSLERPICNLVVEYFKKKPSDSNKVRRLNST